MKKNSECNQWGEKYDLIVNLWFTIKYPFGRYLDSFACYLDFELLSPSEEVEIPASIQIILFPKQINRIHSFRMVEGQARTVYLTRYVKSRRNLFFLLEQIVISRDGLRRFLLDQFNIVLFKKSAQWSGRSHHTRLALTNHQNARFRFQNILDIFDTHWMPFFPPPVRNHAPLNNFYIVGVGHTIYNNFAKRIFFNHDTIYSSLFLVQFSLSFMELWKVITFLRHQDATDLE